MGQKHRAVDGQVALELEHDILGEWKFAALPCLHLGRREAEPPCTVLLGEVLAAPDHPQVPHPHRPQRQ
jgi:hypothetical protein